MNEVFQQATEKNQQSINAKCTVLIAASIFALSLLPSAANQRVCGQRPPKSNTTTTVEKTVENGQTTTTTMTKTESVWEFGRPKTKPPTDSSPADEKDVNATPENQSKEFYLLEGLNKISQLGQYKNAIAEYDRALAIDPNYAAAYLQRAAAYRYLKQYDKAAADFEKAVTLDSINPRIYQERAIYYKEIKEDDKAFADLNAALDLKPDSVYVYQDLEKMRLAAGQNELLIADLSRTIEKHPTVIEARTARREVYRNAKQFDEAIADQNKIIELRPAVPQEYLLRAQLYSSAAQTEAAEKDRAFAGKLIAEAQKSPPAPQTAGSFYGSGTSGIVRRETAGAANIQRGIELSAAGKTAEAVAEFTAALKINPKSVAAYYQRGREYNRLYQYETALADLDRAVELEPNYAGAYQERAIARRGLKQNEAAAKDETVYRQLSAKPNLLRFWLCRKFKIEKKQ